MRCAHHFWQRFSYGVEPLAPQCLFSFRLRSAHRLTNFPDGNKSMHQRNELSISNELIYAEDSDLLGFNGWAGKGFQGVTAHSSTDPGGSKVT